MNKLRQKAHGLSGTEHITAAIVKYRAIISIFAILQIAFFVTGLPAHPSADSIIYLSMVLFLPLSFVFIVFVNRKAALQRNKVVLIIGFSAECLRKIYYLYLILESLSLSIRASSTLFTTEVRTMTIITGGLSIFTEVLSLFIVILFLSTVVLNISIKTSVLLRTLILVGLILSAVSFILKYAPIFFPQPNPFVGPDNLRNLYREHPELLLMVIGTLFFLLIGLLWMVIELLIVGNLAKSAGEKLKEGYTL